MKNKFETQIDEMEERMAQSTSEEERKVLLYIDSIRDDRSIKDFKITWKFDMWQKLRLVVNGHMIKSIYDLDWIVNPKLSE